MKAVAGAAWSLKAHVQFVSLITGVLNWPDLGEQRYHYNLGAMLVEEPRCVEDCIYQSRIATSDALYPRELMLGPHPKAEEVRRSIKA